MKLDHTQIMLNDLKEKLDEVYVKIADASKEEVGDLVDEAHLLEDEIDLIENPPEIPLSQSSWVNRYDVSRKYERFHDEYGDSAAFFSDYSDYHYQIYVKTLKKRQYYSF